MAETYLECKNCWRREDKHTSSCSQPEWGEHCELGPDWRCHSGKHWNALTSASEECPLVAERAAGQETAP